MSEICDGLGTVPKPPGQSIGDTSAIVMEPIEFPFYQVQRRRHKGDIRKFEYISREEFERLGRNKCVELECSRFRSRMISADPEAKAKWSKRRKWRRDNVPGVREREADKERSRKAKC